MPAWVALVLSLFVMQQGEKVSWGQGVGGLRVGMVPEQAGPVSQANIRIARIVANKSDKPVKIDTSRAGKSRKRLENRMPAFYRGAVLPWTSSVTVSSFLPPSSAALRK